MSSQPGWLERWTPSNCWPFLELCVQLGTGEVRGGKGRCSPGRSPPPTAVPSASLMACPSFPPHKPGQCRLSSLCRTCLQELLGRWAVPVAGLAGDLLNKNSLLPSILAAWLPSLHSCLSLPTEPWPEREHTRLEAACLLPVLQVLRTHSLSVQATSSSQVGVSSLERGTAWSPGPEGGFQISHLAPSSTSPCSIKEDTWPGVRHCRDSGSGTEPQT